MSRAQSLTVSDWSRAIALGYAGVQSLSARTRDAGKQCLTNKFMREGERAL